MRILSLAFLVLVLLFPLGFLFLKGFQLQGFEVIGSDPGFWQAFRFTYLQALASASLSLGVGGFCAWIWSENEFWGRSFLFRTTLAFFCLPTLLVVLSVLSLWGTVGNYFGFSLFGWRGILLGNALLNVPLAIKWIGLALQQREVHWEKTALSLGASRFKAFSLAVWPQISQAVKNSFLISFLLSSSNFILVLFLGGGPRYQTLEVLIFESTKMDLNLARATAIGASQALLALLLYSFFFREEKIRSFALASSHSFLHIRSKNYRRMAIGISLTLFGGFCFAPVAGFVIHSLAFLDKASLEWIRPFCVSLCMAISVGALALIIGVGIAQAALRVNRLQFFFADRLLVWTASLPFSLSSILISLAIFASWGQWIMDFSAWKILAIIAVQATLALPLVWPPIALRWRQLLPEYQKAARSLGATSAQVFWKVELPWLRTTLISSFCLAAGFSIGEVGSVMVFYSDEAIPLSLHLQRLMGQYRFDEAFGVGTLLLLLTVVFLAVGSHWEEKNR